MEVVLEACEAVWLCGIKAMSLWWQYLMLKTAHRQRGAVLMRDRPAEAGEDLPEKWDLPSVYFAWPYRPHTELGFFRPLHSPHWTTHLYSRLARALCWTTTLRTACSHSLCRFRGNVGSTLP